MDDNDGDTNTVTLVGRMSASPERRTMPSGDELVTFRLVVRRRPAPPSGGVRSRQSVDVIDCAVWGGRVRRAVLGWAPGDTVSVEGAIRRRFYRAGASTASRVEVEVAAGRLIRRGAPS